MTYRDHALSNELRLTALEDELREVDRELERLKPLVTRRAALVREIELRVERQVRAMRPGTHVAVWIGTGVALVVLAGLVGLSGALLVPWRSCHSPLRQTRSDAQAVRSAVLLYLGQEPGATCPSVHDLVRAGTIDHGRRITDAWDRPYRVVCDGDDILVISDGPDRLGGTADDVR